MREMGSVCLNVYGEEEQVVSTFSKAYNKNEVHKSL